MIDTITDAVRSEKRGQDNGGCGTIAKFDKAGVRGIVVSQTWPVHLEIEALLDRLRKARGRALTADDIKKLPLEPEPSRSLGPDQPPRLLEADPRRNSIVEANNQFAFDLDKKTRRR